MQLIKNKKALMELCVLENSSAIINRACLDIVDAVSKMTGVTLNINRVKDFSRVKNSIIISRFDGDKNFENYFKTAFDYTKSSDGFCVMQKDENIYILAHCDSGVFYGAHDFLEKNAPVIWARGTDEYQVETLFADEISATVIDFFEKSPFKVRVWNTCGTGTDGVDHGDTGTAKTLGRNKITGVFHHCNDDWYEYAVTGQSLASAEFRSIEEYIDTNPEYFMTYEDGTPRKLVVTNASQLESYINFYHPEVAKIIAKKMSAYLDKCHEKDVACYNMPDNPYFFMRYNGVNLHEQPFTTDCGVTVYPEDANYKSTVYFNFINRLIKELNEIRPNTIIHTQAYMYSEIAPAIKVDDRVIVKVAPLTANMKVSHNDAVKKDNVKVRDNLIKWCEKSNNVTVNSYWGAFNGHYYSRPIVKVAQQDMLFWKDIGVIGFTPSGRVDCNNLPNMSEKQSQVRKYNDFNETYTWILHKLMWEPSQDIEKLKERYCKIVYKEVANDMLEYFKYIEQGYDKTDAFVWWMNGADVLIYQFIIKAGVKEGVLNSLKRACARATTPTVKERVESIYATLSEYIARYESFVDEAGEILWIDGVNPVSEENLNGFFTEESVWSKAKPSVVIKDFFTLEPFGGGLDVSRKMFFNGENLYFAYALKDKDIDRVVENGEKLEVYRKDGTQMGFRVESYFGGNALNTEKYFGYVSGFNVKDAHDQYFVNAGSPSKMPFPDGVKTIKKVFTSKEDGNKRALLIVQIVPLKALDVNICDFKPYGHFCVFTEKHKKGGWKGFGLWSKQNFTTYNFDRKIQKN